MSRIRTMLQQILPQFSFHQNDQQGRGFAPVNIALCKYWGKRDAELNLPAANSLSLTLPEKGVMTSIHFHDKAKDEFFLNGQLIDEKSYFYQRIQKFLNYFRENQNVFFRIQSFSDLPTSAGLASSAAGFAALVLALNDLFDWQLSQKQLSILARLGSGSACRSFSNGFVLWQKGEREDGMDSYGIPLTSTFEGLRVGILLGAEGEKNISSRQAMEISRQTSPFYSQWIDQCEKEVKNLMRVIDQKDFDQFGKIIEHNALAMHAVMMSSWPSIIYHTAITLENMQRIWQARKEGVPIYFSQDAGPHLKLFFMQDQMEAVLKLFPEIEIMTPFTDASQKQQVIVVDEHNHAKQYVEKLAAHDQALLHRAISVFVFRHHQGGRQVLMQKRHDKKYHCANLWSNSCCSHPFPGEHISIAAKRRLFEELGIDATLEYKGDFRYRAEVGNGLVEHELDAVFVTDYSAAENDINFNREEMSAVQWMDVQWLQKDLEQQPQNYTPWLKQALTIALRS